MGKKIGMETARAVKKRVDQLRAADNFFMYIRLGLGRPHPLPGTLKGRYGIRVTRNIRLIVKPMCEQLDSLSLQACKAIIIEGVADYHGTNIEWIIP